MLSNAFQTLQRSARWSLLDEEGGLNLMVDGFLFPLCVCGRVALCFCFNIQMANIFMFHDLK